MPVKPIPDGYRTLTPGCILDDAAAAIDLYRRAFDARVEARYDAPDGSVAHAELMIGDSRLMLGQAGPRQPRRIVGLMMYVPDVDATFRRATSLGFAVNEPPTDQFWGDRATRLTDPHGNEWFVATHVEDVAPDELKRRMAKLFGGG